jgi:hypothetical protein
MTENSEPTRWLDSLDDAPAQLRALLLAETHSGSSHADMPAAAQLARVLQRVASEVKRPELCHALSAQQAPAPARWSRRLGLVGKAAIGLALLGCAVMAWRYGHPPEVRSAPRVAAPFPTPSPSALPPGQPAIVAIPPPAAPAVHAPSKARVTTHVVQPARVANDPSAELALLEQAQRALHQDPERALALAHQHELTFAKGQFVQEREMLAIEALQALGRHASAARRGQSFLRRFPQSSHAPRLQRLLGSPER